MRIVKIEPAGEEPVYNMEVEDTHDFAIGPGIVAHNCYDECRYVFMRHPINPRRNALETPHGWDPLDLWKDDPSGMYMRPNPKL